MHDALTTDLDARLAEVRSAGLFKEEHPIDSPQGARVELDDGRDVVNLCSNNYLGLADHADVVAAAREALDRWGFGMASVRFICGTQTLHRELEERLATFLGTEAAILFSSCFDANAGLFEALLDDRDAIISDALNHASIIDGVRLCKAARYRYANSDMDELEARLEEAAGARHRVIVTDGVFSMDGYLADLPGICELAERHGATVLVDDSHAVGFVGPTGRGSPEHHGVQKRVDILTGTLGKALGGASGGYVAGPATVVETLRQRARPYLFSNSVAPPIAAAALTALDLVERTPELRDRLWSSTARFRSALEERGLEVLPGGHPIIPVMIGDAQRASRFAAELFREGVYAVAFSYPVVPHGTARIRTQVSAAHDPEQLDRAADVFARAAAATAA